MQESSLSAVVTGIHHVQTGDKGAHEGRTACSSRKNHTRLDS